MRGALLLLAVLATACDSNDYDPVTLVDAPAPDVPDPYKDAPYTCTPIAPLRGPPPACLALTPDSLRGKTPFGNLDLALDYFGAGDCITISSATIAWRGACGELLHLSFPYPVTSDGNRRSVAAGTFTTLARFEYAPPAMPHLDETTMIQVDVTKWQEGAGVHDIDITVSVPNDSRYVLAPLRVAGTFCDWAYLLC